MDVLPSHFRALRFLGLWHETIEPHWLVKYIWRPFTVNSIVLFTIMQLAALLVYRDNVRDFTDCLFLSLTYFGLCLKLLNFLRGRAQMNELLGEFRATICRATSNRERDVLARYEKIIAILFKSYFVVIQLLGAVVAITPLLSMAAGNEEVFLPFKTYELGNKDNRLYYWATYAFQVVANVICISTNITLDMLLAGFLLLTCGQIDLCCCRFTCSLNHEIRRSTRDCLVHQLLIWRIVQKIEDFFMITVLPLMFLRLISICTSTYNVTQAGISAAESITYFVYLIAIMYEVFFYCWFANELNLKSTAICDAVYNSDWTALQPEDRKILYFVMLSCRREMSISFHGFCTLTIDIFVWVLKTSYTAYNLLKTVETKNGP